MTAENYFSVSNSNFSIQPKNEQLLIYYICSHHHAYLKMLVLSIESFLNKTDMRNYHVKVYLDKKLSVYSKEINLLHLWNIEVILIDINNFPSKQQVLYRDENKKFNNFIVIDTDAFVIGELPTLFHQLVNSQIVLGSPIRSSGNDTAANCLIGRQFQSIFNKQNSIMFIELFKQFIDKNAQQFLDMHFWNWGWFTFYNKTKLDQDPNWTKCYDFVVNFLKTTCDETLFMLYYFLTNKTEDLSKYFCFGGGIEESKNIINGIIHPIWGDDCRKINTNKMLLDQVREVNPVLLKSNLNSYEEDRNYLLQIIKAFEINNLEQLKNGLYLIKEDHKIIRNYLMSNDIYGIIMTTSNGCSLVQV